VSDPKITPEQFNALAADKLPFGGRMGYQVEEIGYGTARMRMPVDEQHLRPGGTVAGPALRGLADATMYAVVLGMVGPVELAVTTNLTCNFLRRPSMVDIVAEGRILKLGKRLAVGEVSLYSEGDPEPAAHVTATYSIPPESTE
tara:strand:- start:513 stop:944 length:432 start_codon:yes stop_codon:yes gene_type:complete